MYQDNKQHNMLNATECGGIKKCFYRLSFNIFHFLTIKMSQICLIIKYHKYLSKNSYFILYMV